MSKPSTSDLTPPANLDVPQKSSMTPTLLAQRLRHLSDELTWLAHAVPEKDQETWSELLRARDAIWFAAKRVHPLK